MDIPALGVFIAASLALILTPGRWGKTLIYLPNEKMIQNFR